MGERKQLSFLLSGKIAAFIFTMLVPMVLTRILDKSDYGLYAQFYVIVLLFTQIAPMAFSTSLYYFYKGLSNIKKQTLVLQTYFILFFLAVTSVLLLDNTILHHYFIKESGLVEYKIFLYIAIVLMVIMTLLNPLYVLNKHIKISLFYPPAEIAVKAISILGFCTFFGFTIRNVFYAILISLVINFIFFNIYVIKTGMLRIQKFNIRLFAEQLSYSLPFGVAVMIKTISLKVDRLISINYISSAEYAIYSIAFFGVPGLIQIFSSFVEVYITKMTSLYKSNEMGKLIDVYHTLILKTFSFTAPLVLIIFVFSKQVIILLFSDKYIDAVPYFRIYLLIFLFVPLGSGLILRSIGKTKIIFKAYLISSIISIPLAFSLISHFHTLGAIISATIGFILPIIIVLIFENRFLNIKLSRHFPFKKMGIIFLFSLIVFIPFLYLNEIYNISILLAILLGSLYLFLVIIFEISKDLFIFKKETVYMFINRVKERFL